MRAVEFACYYLPPAAGSRRRKPYPSSWKMTTEEAAAQGLCPQDKVVGTAEVRDMPETDDERQRVQVHYPSAGHGGVMPPRS